MPSESMPRMPRRAIVRPSGIAVPSVASGTTSPAAKLNAPHQTWRSPPVAGVDPDPLDLGRVGMRLGAHDARGDDARHAAGAG